MDSNSNEQLDEVEKNVSSIDRSPLTGNVSAENMTDEADSQGLSSDYDFCEDSDGVDENSIDKGMKGFKAESPGIVSEHEADIQGLCEDIDAVDENSIGSSKGEDSSGAVSELKSDDKDFCEHIDAVEESMKSLEAESSGADSEFESDGYESNGPAGNPENMDIQLICNGARDIEFGGMPHYWEMNDQEEFKQMKLRNIVEENAFPFLPAKSLTRFRSVSKRWNSWIKAPILSHRQSYKFRNMSGYFHESGYSGGISFISLCRPAYGVPDPSLGFLSDQSVVPLARKFSIMSSCNGLLLCRKTNGDMTYYVCNPTTKQWKELPQPSCYHGEDPSIILAFEPSVLNIGAHFKLVCAFQLLDEPVLAFEIYSSETNSWKCVEDLCAELTDAKLKNNGFYFNGMAYWETTSNEVLAFDLSSEIHSVLPLPIVLPCSLQGSGTLAQMKGELCYVSAQKRDESVVEVSFYMGLGNMSLKRSISFDLGTRLDLGFDHVLPGLSDDTVMINVHNCIYVCNVNDQTVNTVKTGWSRSGGKYLPYVNSLVYIA